MSEHYNRNQYAPPESYQAKISTAWLEHNQRFRPALRKLQDLIASTAYKYDKKGAWQKALSKYKLTQNTMDYIMLSMTSFLQYLTEYCTYFTIKKFEDNNFEISNKEAAKLFEFNATNAQLALLKTINMSKKSRKSKHDKNGKDNNSSKSPKSNRHNTRRRSVSRRSNDSNEQSKQSATKRKLQTRRKRRTISN